MKKRNVFLFSALAAMTAFFSLAAADDAAPPPMDAQLKSQEEFLKLAKPVDEAWDTRHINGNQKALELARKFYKDYSSTYDAAWRLARAAFWVAENADSSDVKEKVGNEGYKAGLEAQKANPNGVEGYMFGAAALGQYAKGVGILSALSKGLGGKFVSMAEKAIAIDKKYAQGGPLRTLGRYYFTVPWPKKDLAKSTKLLEEACRIGPEKLRNHAYLGDTYLDDGRKEQAVKEYKICSELDPNKEDVADGIIHKDYCKKKLAELSK